MTPERHACVNVPCSPIEPPSRPPVHLPVCLCLPIHPAVVVLSHLIERSAEVLVECGPSDALVAADELEIGVYRLVMETPLACTESDLREAEQRVEVFQVGRGWSPAAISIDLLRLVSQQTTRDP